MSQKLCIECRFCTASNADQSRAEMPLCMKGGKSPVDGGYTDSCQAQRSGWVNLHSGVAGTCGQAGLWFEPRAKASAGMP